MATKLKQRPASNRDYKVLNRKTGLFETVKASRTPIEGKKVFCPVAKYKQRVKQ